jgi:hypothetical protein
MPGNLITIGELKRRLIKLLRKKYEESNCLRNNSRRIQRKLDQIDHKIQLMKAICKRRANNIAEITSIINTWELINDNNECQENLEAEPMELDGIPKLASVDENLN